MIARRILYRGQVQGVGFRVTAREIAVGFAVVGTVRNLDDGDVELIVEGQPAEVDRFLMALGARMADAIDERIVEDREPQGFSNFSIVR